MLHKISRSLQPTMGFKMAPALRRLTLAMSSCCSSTWLAPLRRCRCTSSLIESSLDTASLKLRASCDLLVRAL